MVFHLITPLPHILRKMEFTSSELRVTNNNKSTNNLLLKLVYPSQLATYLRMTLIRAVRTVEDFNTNIVKTLKTYYKRL